MAAVVTESLLAGTEEARTTRFYTEYGDCGATEMNLLLFITVVRTQEDG